MSFIINSIPAVQPIFLPLFGQQRVAASVLRLDAVHPVVSGNKWYKLKMYLAAALEENKKTVVTFGGAYSNHIVATAAACAAAGLSSYGIIRGEKAPMLAPTLLQAASLGMHLFFTSREAYSNKVIPEELALQLNGIDHIIIPEGGYGEKGMKGAATIFDGIDIRQFTHILCAVGTGTTLAGLVLSSLPHQHVMGISVLKNNFSLQQAVQHLLPESKMVNYQLLHNHHCGGYAKHTPELLAFMDEWYRQTGIPSDFVYTGKLFFAFQQLCADQYFPPGSNVLLVHSGGLQGNRSLRPGTLIFGSE